MNAAVIEGLIDQALAKAITFPAILKTLEQEGVESYHVDFARNETRYYGAEGASYASTVPLVHDSVAQVFSKDRLVDVNRRVQAGEAWYPDFVREAAAAGCAYYIVYVKGGKVRYFGRDGDEHVQYFPGAAPPATSAGLCVDGASRSSADSFDHEGVWSPQAQPAPRAARDDSRRPDEHAL